ncbi:VanZ family protein [Streptomyces sp. NPDC102282]|uniref:VanZ family protein n=1 Tax=Streptomyces sp. NPDC102282 TaxID=3366154 RepID=UPI003802F170
MNHDVLEPFTTDQGILNAGLFFPIGLLGVLATKKVVSALMGGILLTFSIETLQATLTFLGRGCDTSDLQMNSLGVAAGALVGWAIVYLDDRNGKFLLLPERRQQVTALVAVAALTISWLAFITPQGVSHTVGIGRANAKQEAAVRDSVEKIFGDHYEVKNVDFARGPAGSGTVMASFDEGFAELSWPDQRKFSASLDISDAGKPSGFPVSRTQKPPVDSVEAQAIATRFIQDRAVWSLNAKPRSTAVGAKAELGWMTSWRRHNSDGVLMPMRLDVQVDRTGRVTQLIMLNEQDPKLSKPLIKKETAVSAILEKAESASTEIQGSDVKTELIAKKVDSTWRTVWLIAAQAPKGPVSGSVDASSGKVISFNPGYASD